MNYYNFETDTIFYKDKVIKNFFYNFTQQQEIKDYVKLNLMMLYVSGSHAYGMATEDSDIDIRGIFKDNIDMILGSNKIEQLSNETNDITIYSLTKALHLIAEQNPNMQELLWVDEEDILYATDDYWFLRNKRWELLSTLSRYKYSGYAISQLKRLKGHSKWLVKEQKGKFNKKPNIKDYLLGVNHKGNISRSISDKRNYYYTKIKDELYNIWQPSKECSKSYPSIEDGNSFIPIQEGHKEIDNHRGVLLFNKSQFQKDLDEYNNWKKWKDNRNEKRHELEELYGYDTKHASHTFRLLNTGIEILKGEGVKVKRPDSQFLIDIRNGKYSYEWVMTEAERLDTIVLDEAYNNSKLPKNVDKKIVVDIIKHILGIGNII